LDKDHAYIAMAEAAASLSKDPSTKVGALVLDADGRVAGTGYNGFPQAIPDSPEKLNNRDEKYKRVIHAEMNAILFAGRSCAAGTLYATHEPCEDCAKHIIQAGIRRVVYLKTAERFTSSVWLFDEAGVKVQELGTKGDTDAA